MAKDYAKYTSIKRVPKKKQRSHLVASFILLIFIGTFAYGFYTFKQHPSSRLGILIGECKAVFHHQKNQTMIISKPQTEIAKAEQEVHFDFYNELPNMQVSAGSSNSKFMVSKSTVPKTTAATETNYIVRINTFKNENDASQIRVSLLLSGIDADIVKIGGNYRIQQGPYSTLLQAKAMQKKLLKKGIESQVEKL